MRNNLNKTVNMVVLAGLLLFLAGCLAVSGNAPAFRSSGGCYQQDFNKLLEYTELKKVFVDIANELCVDTCNDCSRQAGLQVKTACGQNDKSESSQETVNRTVLVTDFVDIQSFVPKQQGILMGELMRGSLNSNCCYRIVQAEFGKYFKLSESGLVVLSRNVGVIKNDGYKQPECIVGTYSIMNNKLILFVRRINTDTGKISKMVTREITYLCSGKQVTYTVN